MPVFGDVYSCPDRMPNGLVIRQIYVQCNFLIVYVPRSFMWLTWSVTGNFDVTALALSLVTWKLLKWLRNVVSLSRSWTLINYLDNAQSGLWLICLLSKLKWSTVRKMAKSQLISVSHLSIRYI